MNQPTEYLIDYLEAQGVMLKEKDYLEKLSTDNSKQALNDALNNTSNQIDNTANTDNSNVVEEENIYKDFQNNNTNTGEALDTPEIQNPTSSIEVVPPVNSVSVDIPTTNSENDLEKTQFLDVFSKNNG